MEKNIEAHFKLTLGYDFIMFMINLHNDGLTNEQKIRRTNMILEAWEQRLDTSIAIMGNKNVEELSKTTGDGIDVLQILQEIHALESNTVRKEFKREIKSFAAKVYGDQNVGR